MAPPPIIRRSITTTSTTTFYEPIAEGSSLSHSPSSTRQNTSDSSLGTSAGLVGSLLGAAAVGAALGAGIAYGAIRSMERGGHNNNSSSSEFEAPPFQRRSTAPPAPRSRYLDDYGRRDVDDDYALMAPPLSIRRSPPTLLSAEGRKPLLLTDVEHRSYVGSRHGSARTTSEMMNDLAAAEQRSAAVGAGSRHDAAASGRSRAPSQYSRRSSRHSEAADRESYVSTRSHRSASTVRPLQATVQTELTGPTMSLVSRPKAASRVSRAPSGMETPRSSRSQSYVSARQVPLPASRVGSSRASYREREEDEDDDACSIAPSDSISCVGSRKASRVHV